MVTKHAATVREFLHVMSDVQPKRLSVKKAHSQPVINTSAAEPQRPLVP